LCLSEFSSTGTPISGSSGYTGGGLSAPSGVAIDASGNVWAADNGVSGGTEGGNSLSEFSLAGMPISGSTGYTGGGLVNPFTLAIDPSGNIWVTDSDPATAISEFNSSGVAISGSSGFTGGGLNAPVGIAFDGAGNVFLSNYGGNNISKFDSAGAPISNTNGWQGGLSGPAEIAIDGAGNAWVTSSGNNTIVEFVGLGRSPVVTPIVANLVTPYGTHAVNKP
jgi:streptogramin lyase